ncbi:MAG: zf-HC2 domain-containing protein [Nocardioidaceae bacterium]|nr:zf-HC2 domain-containing protein [Nocardioidaceae bacterium]
MSRPDNPHTTTEQLADLLEGVLTPADEEAAQDHLRGCDACRTDYDLLAGLPALLASVPAPELPPAVASRLDDAIAAEDARRDTGPRVDTSAAPSRSPRREPRREPRRSDRTRRWLVGVAAAAAAVVSVGLVGDVWLSGFDQGGASESSEAGGASEGSAKAASDDARSPRGLAALPSVGSETFAADVDSLYDPARGGFPGTSGLPDKDKSVTLARGPDAYPGQVRRAARGCTAATLRASGVDGRFGPLVAVDGRLLARLAATGPARAATVTAYSCRDQEPIAAAQVGNAR